MPLEIPKTKIRLLPYVQVAGGKDAVSTTKVIGASQKLSINVSRSTNFYRELDAEKFGQIVETYPQLPTYKLTLEKLVLYNENLLQAFGYGTGNTELEDQIDLLRQTEPLAVEVRLFSPKINNQESPTITYRFEGCWIESFPLEFNMTTADLKIVQSTSMTSKGVTVVKQ